MSEQPFQVPEVETQRRVIHVDMDAFYASVEQRDDPKLRGRPVAVSGLDRRAVVATASYEARAFGVRSAIPTFKAREMCKDLLIVPPRFDVYRAVSAEIREIFLSYTPLVEPLSLDEAYLDVTEAVMAGTTASKIAKEIRGRILEKTRLTASAGVSFNKFLAKTASGVRKPDDMFVITPEMAPDFVAALPVRKFHGIGPATAARLEGCGIKTGGDLRGKDLEFLRRNFGKSGEHFFWISRCIDRRAVNPDRERKSAGAEITFDADLRDAVSLKEALGPIVEKAWSRCERVGARGRTVVLKIKYSDFTQVTRSRTLPAVVSGASELGAVAVWLLEQAPLPQAVRLLGVTLSGLEDDDREEPAQLSLALPSGSPFAGAPSKVSG